jgi:DNA-binding phage protein
MLITIERDYAVELNSLVDQIYQRAADVHDWSWAALAYQAGLSYSTVLKLGNYETRLPHLRTVYKLAKAVGLRVTLVATVAKKHRKAS